MIIKKWFIQKNFDQQEAQALKNGYEVQVLRETEKAYYLAMLTDLGVIKSWVPKSVIITDEEYITNKQKGINYYNQLLNLAKSKGLAVRKRMKLTTIKAKLDEANIDY